MSLTFNATERQSLIDTLSRSFGIALFSSDGAIQNANDALCGMLGYDAEDIVGLHHNVLISKADLVQNRELWHQLRNGSDQAGEYRLIDKNGGEHWVRGFYTIIRDEAGATIRIALFANDITEQHLDTVDLARQLHAIDRSHAVVEFDTGSRIIDANSNFLKISGYRLDELVGRHHHMFLEPSEAQGEAYEQFWEDLRAGHYKEGEFRRIGKDGTPFWLRAVYSPILDTSGRTTRIVKFALDITEDVKLNHDAAAAVLSSRDLYFKAMSEISAVAKGIESITQQTKLLALNARIEAARVGEEGRSFAVVASEISSLSARIASSTAAISKLVHESAERSDAGSDRFYKNIVEELEGPLALRTTHG